MSKMTQVSEPQLRFPEFGDVWKERKLGEVFEQFSKKSKVQDEYEVLTSARSGLVRQHEYYDNNRITERDNIGFNILPQNYLTYRSRSDDRRFYFNENTLGITGIVSVYYPVFRIAEGDNRFFRELFERHKDYLGKFSVGTSQTVLSYNELKKVRLHLPSLPEQKKIADFLEAVDGKLVALREKEAALTRFKRGLMQALFSQTLRFTRDDGSNYPDWEERRLGTLGRFIGGGTPDTDIKDYWKGDIPWVSSSDVLEADLTGPTISRWITNEAIEASATKLVPSGSILIVTRVGVGKLTIANCDLCTSQDFTNFIPTGVDARFIGYNLLNEPKKLLRLCQGTSIKGLTTDDLKDLVLKIPCADEQHKIVFLLSAVDAKIDAVTEQITQLDAFKKGLLQQMFV